MPLADTAVQPLIQSRILTLRGLRVMLDADLAQLYGVQTRALVQAVKRNAKRFPPDFMFQLDAGEFEALKSQTVISNAAPTPGRGGRRSAPYAFTEQGVAMLSSVLTSEQAVAMNVSIMRTFVRVRELALAHKDLAQQLAELQERMERLEMGHDTFSANTRAQLRQVMEALRGLRHHPSRPDAPSGSWSRKLKSAKTHRWNRTTTEATFTPRADETPKAEYDAWFRRQVQIGLNQADAGELIPSEEVEAYFAAKRAETRRKLPQASAD